MKRLRVLFVLGTRPEGIKLAPVIKRAGAFTRELEPLVCSTGQHREMLQQVVDYFGFTVDTDLQLMKKNQALAQLSADCLSRVDEELRRREPDCVVVQGDTATAMAASLAAFFRRVPVVHVEAGLRTGDLQAPWPEELNRRIISLAADFHCAPTQEAARSLRQEGFPEARIEVTGNTVIDALLATLERERNNPKHIKKYSFLGSERMVLITGHRRENFGPRFESIWQAILQLARDFPEDHFVYPVHLNPSVWEPAHAALDGQCANIHLVEPAAYPEFVWLMNRASLILSDSGGVQEEAPSLKKPVLILRDTTEREEVVRAGAAILVGSDTEKIIEQTSALLTDNLRYRSMQLKENPYGDGHAADRIVEILRTRRWQTSSSRKAA